MNSQEIFAKAIVVSDGMEICYPQNEQSSYIWVEDYHLAMHEGKYACKNGVVAIVTSGTLYVIPEISNICETLENMGLKKEDFDVPFSNGDYPVAKKAEWEALLKERH